MGAGTGIKWIRQHFHLMYSQPIASAGNIGTRSNGCMAYPCQNAPALYTSLLLVIQHLHLFSSCAKSIGCEHRKYGWLTNAQSPIIHCRGGRCPDSFRVRRSACTLQTHAICRYLHHSSTKVLPTKYLDAVEIRSLLPSAAMV